MTKPIIVMQTDFTYKEAAVSAMMGVIKTIDPDLQIYHATHEIPQYDIYTASYRLYQPFVYWPNGTIFISVVDPGVGTQRRGCVALAENGSYIVTPDNGTLTHIQKHIGIKAVREIDTERHRLRNHGDVAIFHGRDVFAYTAAKLASGVISYEEVGPLYDCAESISLPLSEAVIDEEGAEGVIDIADPNFGNLWTNIKTEDFRKYHKDSTFTIKVGSFEMKHVAIVAAFGECEKGSLLLYNNELGYIGLALNQASLNDKWKIPNGTRVRISKERINEKNSSTE